MKAGGGVIPLYAIIPVLFLPNGGEGVNLILVRDCIDHIIPKIDGPLGGKLIKSSLGYMAAYVVFRAGARRAISAVLVLSLSRRYDWYTIG